MSIPNFRADLISYDPENRDYHRQEIPINPQDPSNISSDFITTIIEQIFSVTSPKPDMPGRLALYNHLNNFFKMIKKYSPEDIASVCNHISTRFNKHEPKAKALKNWIKRNTGLISNTEQISWGILRLHEFFIFILQNIKSECPANTIKDMESSVLYDIHLETTAAFIGKVIDLTGKFLKAPENGFEVVSKQQLYSELATFDEIKRKEGSTKSKFITDAVSLMLMNYRCEDERDKLAEWVYENTGSEFKHEMINYQNISGEKIYGAYVVIKSLKELFDKATPQHAILQNIENKYLVLKEARLQKSVEAFFNVLQIEEIRNKIFTNQPPDAVAKLNCCSKLCADSNYIQFFVESINSGVLSFRNLSDLNAAIKYLGNNFQNIKNIRIKNKNGIDQELLIEIQSLVENCPNIESVQLCESKITVEALDELQNFQTIKRMEINNLEVKPFKSSLHYALPTLPLSLQELKISGGKIIELGSLTSLPNLKNLELCNLVCILTPLEDITTLEKLKLASMRTLDLSFLSNKLVLLKELTIENSTRITHLEALQNIPSIDKLHLIRNNIQNYEFLPQLQSVKDLRIVPFSFSKRNDLFHFQKLLNTCEMLTTLSLEIKDIKNLDVDALCQIPNLAFLNIHYDKLVEAPILNPLVEKGIAICWNQ